MLPCNTSNYFSENAVFVNYILFKIKLEYNNSEIQQFYVKCNNYKNN